MQWLHCSAVISSSSINRKLGCYILYSFSVPYFWTQRYYFVKKKVSFLIFLFMASTAAYGSSQARGWIGAATEIYTSATASQIWAKSATYLAACDNAGFLSHGARPRIEPTSSRRPRQVLNLLNHSGNSKNWVFKSSNLQGFDDNIRLDIAYIMPKSVGQK